MNRFLPAYLVSFLCTVLWLLGPVTVSPVFSDDTTRTVVYDFAVNGTPGAGTWTIIRTYGNSGMELSCSGTAQFRMVVPVTYEFLADARYDHSGRLIRATSYIDTIGLNHHLRVHTAEEHLVIEKRVRERPWREIPSGESQFTTLDFFNPASVRRFFTPYQEVEYEGIDLEQGKLRTLRFTVERTYDHRFSRRVLRVANKSMEMLYDGNSLELLYNRVTEMGITAEMVIRE